MDNIVLIGMMGSGKSTIARALKAKLDYDVYDTDDVIEKTSGMTIDQIFSKNGEMYFRQLENDLCKTLGLHKNIISTGGGMVTNPENVDFLRKQGKIVYLFGDKQTLLYRLMNETENRPLLSIDKLDKQLSNLLDKRKDIYENSADLIVSIDDKDVDTISDEIILNLSELGYKFN